MDLLARRQHRHLAGKSRDRSHQGLVGGFDLKDDLLRFLRDHRERFDDAHSLGQAEQPDTCRALKGAPVLNGPDESLALAAAHTLRLACQRDEGLGDGDIHDLG